MTKSTFGDQSTTASSNTTIDGNDASENCVMSGLNNIDRALAAMGKSLGTFITTAGTDTYTATFAPVPDALATDFFYGVNFASANTSTTPTFNPSGLGPKTITDTSGNALVAGALNGRHILIYDGTNFRVLNPAKFTPMSDATNGGLTVSAGTIALNPNDLTAKTSRAAADSIVINDVAGGNVAKKITFPNALSGMPIQIVSTETGAVATGTTTISSADTIPTNTAGDQYMSLSITPTNASSRLFITVIDFCSSSAAAGTAMTSALFQDSTANALAAGLVNTPATGGLVQHNYTHEMTAGTTSATTFKVRIGGNNSGTTTFNGTAGGRVLGGVLASSIIITETLP